MIIAYNSETQKIDGTKKEAAYASPKSGIEGIIKDLQSKNKCALQYFFNLLFCSRNIQEVFLLRKQEFICKECGQVMKKLTISHARSCGFQSTLDYYKKWEPEEYYYRVVGSWMMGHYIQKKYSWIKLVINARTGSEQYLTVDTIKNKEDNEETGTTKFRTFPLAVQDIKEHLMGEYIIGTKFWEAKHPDFKDVETSTLAGIDVDDGNFETVKKLLRAIEKRGIEQKDVLISASGKKGYHMDIFFAHPVLKRKIKLWFDSLIAETELEKVELRGGGNQGYKVPLGYRRSTDTWCNIFDSNLEMIHMVDRTWIIERLQEIKKQPPEVLNISNLTIFPTIEKVAKGAEKCEELERKTKRLPKYSNLNKSSVTEMERLIENGLVKRQDGNNDKVFRLALYLKDYKKLAEDQAVSFVENWIKTVCPDVFYENEFIEKSTRTVRSAFKDKYRFNVNAHEIFFTKEDALRILEIGPSMKKRNARRQAALELIYYLFLVHGKAYHGDDDHSFFVTYNQLQEAGAPKDDRRLLEYINELVDMGFIKRVKSNNTLQRGKYAYRKPYYYTLPGITFNAAGSAAVQVDINNIIPLKKIMPKIICSKDRDRYIAKLLKKRVG